MTEEKTREISKLQLPVVPPNWGEPSIRNYIQTSGYLREKARTQNEVIIIKKLTCLQLFPWNSLFTIAFCAYIIGDIQYPHTHQFFISSGAKDKDD